MYHLELLLCRLDAFFFGFRGGDELEVDDEELGVCGFVLEDVSEGVGAGVSQDLLGLRLFYVVMKRRRDWRYNENDGGEGVQVGGGV